MTLFSSYYSVLCLLFVISQVFHSTNGLRVGSFNIKRFGVKAMDDETRSARIVQILKGFDIILIIEVSDVSETVIDRLTSRLEQETGEEWQSKVSERLGRSKRYKEQYAYVFRVSEVSIPDSYQVKDETYIRPPFAVVVEYPHGGQRVVLMGIHTRPKDAEKELKRFGETVKELYHDVYNNQFPVIAMGDFNADCSYLSNKKEAKLDIFNNGEFDSFVPDEWDTTASDKTNCAYDRLVSYPSGSVDVQNVAVYKIEQMLNINNKEAQRVSDHYPVTFEL